jgi:hypothetical protein
MTRAGSPARVIPALVSLSAPETIARNTEEGVPTPMAAIDELAGLYDELSSVLTRGKTAARIDDVRKALRAQRAVVDAEAARLESEAEQHLNHGQDALAGLALGRARSLRARMDALAPVETREPTQVPRRRPATMKGGA